MQADVVVERSAEVERLWTRTRQGARNVAGVAFQTAVAVYLLVRATTRERVTVHVKPEGFEDIDCERPDGRRLFVQAKERAGGTTTFSAGDVAAVIDRAKYALDVHPDATLAIVTDARPGRGLDQTGWDEPLSDTVTPDARQRIVDALAPLDEAEVDALLGRCHLIRLEWEAISAQTRTILQTSYELPGAAADLLRARLVDDLEKVAAGQREIGADDATVRAVADVDALAARVSELIDVAALQAPVRSTGVSQAAGMAVLRRFGVNTLDSLLLDQVVGTAVAEAVRRATTS